MFHETTQPQVSVQLAPMYHLYHNAMHDLLKAFAVTYRQAKAETLATGATADATRERIEHLRQVDRFLHRKIATCRYYKVA